MSGASKKKHQKFPPPKKIKVKVKNVPKTNRQGRIARGKLG